MMAQFFGFSSDPGAWECDGLRVVVPTGGESVYLAGKTLDLSEDHAVLVARRGEAVRFVRANGLVSYLGTIGYAWVVRGKSRRNPALAAMVNISNLRGGGRVVIGGAEYPVW